MGEAAVDCLLLRDADDAEHASAENQRATAGDQRVGQKVRGLRRGRRRGGVGHDPRRRLAQGLERLRQLGGASQRLALHRVEHLEVELKGVAQPGHRAGHHEARSQRAGQLGQARLALGAAAQLALPVLSEHRLHFARRERVEEAANR